MSIFSQPMTKREYEAAVALDREKRMEWFDAARFGMFVHYGPYSVTGMHEWYMAVSNSSVQTYEREVTAKFHPRRGCAYEWAKLASEAGMKYMVLTTRHHDGYSMWDSDANPYNVVKYGGDYDVVAEFVDACRKYGLKIGFYHSVMDWHNPDCAEGARDFDARIRFIKYHRDMLTELLTRYGKIDILWYDMCFPLGGENLDFVTTDRMVRQMQPDIIINPRSGLDEDLDTPEENLNASGNQKHWEACMTFNGLSWGYVDPDESAPYAYTPQRIIKMLVNNAKGNGNLLLNIGPAPDGSVPRDAIKPLQTVGEWLRKHGEVVYGTKMTDCDIWLPSGDAVRADGAIYAVQYITPMLGYYPVNGIAAPVKSVLCLSDGREYPFEQEGTTLRILGIEHGHKDDTAHVTVYKINIGEPFGEMKRVMPPALSSVW